MVHGKTTTSSVTGRPLKPSEVAKVSDNKGIGGGDDAADTLEIEIETGEPVSVTWAKMSKSKHNGVDPGQIVEQYGADTARVFVLFKAPPDAVLEWDSNAINGVHRWLGRVWSTVHDAVDAWKEAELDAKDGVGGAGAPADGDGGAAAAAAAEVEHATHAAIVSITAALGDKHSFNTAVSDLMKLTNALRAVPAEHRATREYVEGVRALLVMLAPAAPHIASELWSKLASLPAAAEQGWKREADVLVQRWPTADVTILEQSEMEVAIQIGGKFRGSLMVPSSVMDEADPEVLVNMVAETALGQKWLPEDTSLIVRTIIPQNKKMVGFVLAKKKKKKGKN